MAGKPMLAWRRCSMPMPGRVSTYVGLNLLKYCHCTRSKAHCAVYDFVTAHCSYNSAGVRLWTKTGSTMLRLQKGSYVEL